MFYFYCGIKIKYNKSNLAISKRNYTKMKIKFVLICIKIQNNLIKCLKHFFTIIFTFKKLQPTKALDHSKRSELSQIGKNDISIFIELNMASFFE